MSIRITTVDPDTDDYDYLTSAIQSNRTRNQANTVLYNQLAEAYNQCEVDGIIVVDDLNHKRISNLQKVLTNRGLTRHTDYEIFRPTVDSQGVAIPKSKRQTLFKRLTETLMRVV